MSDLISREALLKEFNQTAIEWLQDGTYQLQFAAGVMCEVMEMVTEAPTVDAEPVVHGHWIDAYPKIEPNPMFSYGICSVCGFEQSISYKLPYCPNCGAKMDEVSE